MYLPLNQAGRRCDVLALVLALLALLATASPAQADKPEVYGVSQGDALSQPAVIWAEARGPSHWMTMELKGPGTSLSARASGRRIHLLESQSSGTPMAWNASKAKPGNYTLIATSFFRGKAWNVAKVDFTVPKPGGEAALEGADIAGTSTNVQNGKADAAVLPVQVNEDGETELPKATFEPSSTQLVHGVRRELPIALDGALPSGADVLVLAWDMDRSKIVDAFAHTIERAPWNVSGESIAELPVGKMELQLHVRHGKQFIQTARKLVQVVAPVADPEPATGLPNVGFASNAPQAFTVGDGKSLALSVGGTLPKDADILAISWSLGKGALVEQFAFTMTQAPFVIPAAQLAKLPAGQNEIQLLVRSNGEVVRKITRTITITQPQTGGNAGNSGSNTDSETGNTANTGADTPEKPTTQNPSNGGTGNSTEVPVITDPTPTGTETPQPDPVPTVAFASGSTTNYTRGSNASINISLDGSLPTGGDVLMLAWHHDQGRMISAFAHSLSGSSMKVRNGMLDKLPGGSVELQAHLRLPQGVVQIAKRNIDVNAPAVDTEPDIVDTNPIPAGAGFTTYAPSSDSRVIYVSASGNDSNSGLSPNAPIKSPRRGYDMLRSGQPDHLLFKAGDTFRGGLGSFEKSGQSSNKPMVIGVYGNGARPQFKTDGDNFVTGWGSVSNVAFVGLHGYANRRDPSSGDYNSNSVPWQERGVSWYAKGENITFEDCHFEWYKDNFVIQAPSEGALRNVRLYRVIANNAWCTKSQGHSQGIYMQGVHDAEIVESIFDHNGWRPNNTSDRTKFNHNLYIQKDNARVNVRRSIVTRGSHNGIQLRGGGIIEDCTIAYNPYSAFVAEGQSAMRRNVVMFANDLNSSYPLGIGLRVLPCVQADVEDNIIANKIATAGWTGGIEVGYRDDIIDPPSSFNVSIRRNIIANWPVDNGKRSIVKATSAANITADSNNILDRASGGDGDPPFVDPTRDIDKYAASIGSGNHDGLLRKATQRGRGAWDDRYAAKGVNAWIKAGFEFLPYD